MRAGARVRGGFGVLSRFYEVTAALRDESAMNCPQCNQTVADEARFCGKCGSQVDSGAGAQLGDFGLATASASGAGTGAAPFAGTPVLPGLLERIKNIILTPKTEWLVIETESTTVGRLYTGYVMPMAGFAAVMSFIRMSVVGVSLPFGGVIRTPVVSGLFSSLVTFVLGLIGLYLVGIVINMLSASFSGRRDSRRALQTAAYSLTPAWLGTALTFLPVGSLLQLAAGIYGIYVLYLGLPVMMQAKPNNASGYTASVVVCTILMGILFGVVGATLGGVGRLTGYGAGSAMYDSRSPEARAAEADQAGEVLGNMLGGALGTDKKGKDGLAANTASTGAAGAAGSNTNPQSAVAAAGGLLAALGGALGGEIRHEPVDFNTLKGMLPTSLPRMQRTDAQGSSQQALGVKSSSATADYSGVDAAGSDAGGNGVGSANPRVQIKIADMSGVSGLLDAASGMVPTGETQSDTGFEKDTLLDGRAVHEKYDRSSGAGEVSAFIAKRFSVEVTGHGVDMPQLEKTLRSIDLARLESMKDAGAQAR
jgi:hypothetical protein